MESQARAHGHGATVRELLKFNKMVRDAKTDEVELPFKSIDFSDVVIVARRGGSFAYDGKGSTATRVGLMILIADNKEKRFLR